MTNPIKLAVGMDEDAHFFVYDIDTQFKELVAKLMANYMFSDQIANEGLDADSITIDDIEGYLCNRGSLEIIEFNLKENQ